MDTKGWCLIPPSTFHDKRLSDFEKLLFGKIIPLVNQTGYCWASNAYLGNELDKSERSIQRGINSLREAGYVQVYQENNYRRIRIDLTGGDNFVGEGVTNLSPEMYTLVTPDTLETQKEQVTKTHSKNLEKEQQIREVFDYWTKKRITLYKAQGRTLYKAALTDPRRKHVCARLSDGYDVEGLKRAIDGCFANDWHVEKGLIELSNIVKSTEKVEYFLSKYDNVRNVKRRTDLEVWEED